MHSQTQYRHIKINNEGSAVITVVVSMLFVIALGAALLFAAYTGYTIKIAERGDKSNFYNASSAMDDIRAGIQQQVTEAIATAYTDALVYYTGSHEGDPSYTPQNDFNNRFIAELSNKQVPVNGTLKYLFISQETNGKKEITGYNLDATKALITGSGTSAVTGGIVGTNSVNGILTSISLKSISLKYVNIDNGYESNLTTDITITVPDFFAGSSVSSSINNSAIIANNSLILNADKSAVIKGGIFVGVGGINVSAYGKTLTIKDGDVINQGALSVSNTAAFEYHSPNNEFWASKITLGSTGKTGTPGSVSLIGKVYVADDLVLDGMGSSATLKGTYFGFGNGTDSSGNINNANPEISSSIIINGQKSNLEISGLTKLSLAGVSFINISNASNNSPIQMGESLSAKSDQLAYLVPVKCINNYASNPCVFDASAVKAPIINENTVLWDTATGPKTLSDYIGNDKGDYRVLYTNLDTQMKIAYVFLVFNDKKFANEYFKAYFTADPSKIAQYLNLYVTLSDKATNAEINAAGNTFYMDDNSTPDNKEDDKLTLNLASEQIYATGLQARYSTIQKQSPYQTYVNTQELAKLGSNTTLEFKIEGKVVAIVTNVKNYTYDKVPPSTVRLIIASDNVEIAKEFTGIVIAGSNIIANANITSELLNSDILTAETDDHISLSRFIRNSAQLGEPTKITKDSWDLDTLVYYENWTKN